MLRVKILPTGETTVETIGISGGRCLNAYLSIKNAVAGRVESNVTTDEFAEEEHQSDSQSQKEQA